MRRVLRVLADDERRRFVLAHHDGAPAFRGDGTTDYACGTLLAIGVSSGMFRSLAFACSCGALNALE